MKAIVVMLIVLIPVCSFAQRKGKVVSNQSAKVSKDLSPLNLVYVNDKYGYVNTKGDTVVPLGKYPMCYTETFAQMAIVASDKKLIAINRNMETLFEVFIFDNGPDNISDGVFRIIKNKKIGYADADGHILIEPKFGCAYPFELGKAMVSDSCTTVSDGEHKRWLSRKWYYVDKTGKKVN